MLAKLILATSALAVAAAVEPTALCSVGMYRVGGAFRSTSDTQGWHDWPGQKCVSCPPGKYSSTTTASSCTPCEAGKYQLLEGQISCKTNSCAAGKYMTTSGEGDDSTDYCANCSPGTISAAAAQRCVKCPAGQYNDKPGAVLADCVPSSCAQGQFQALNPARCVECGRNQYSDTTGATSCKYCQHGVVTRGKTECVARAVLGEYKLCSHTTCQVHDKCEIMQSGKRVCTKKEKFVVTHKGTAHNESSWDNGIRHKCTYSKAIDECKCICWNPANPTNLPPLTAAPTSKVGQGCTCAQVYAPVTCSNGRTYSNLCHAECHRASGCTSVTVNSML